MRIVFFKAKFTIKRYLTNNRLGKWYYALLNDDGKEFWKCVKIIIQDRETKKILKTTSVPGFVHIPDHVRQEAQEKIKEFKSTVK